MTVHPVVVQLNGIHQPELVVQDCLNHGLQWRLQTLQPFINLAAKEFSRLGHRTCRFAVQLHDEDPEGVAFRFDAPLVNDQRGPLIPDPYALGSEGFRDVREDVFPNLPPWRERLPMAIWRGASTGRGHLIQTTITTLPRYRLCQFSLERPDLLDARFSTLVQAANSAAHEELRDHLLKQGLLRGRLSPHDLALHRWMVEIDGNVNSWGLLWKLLSGSCILRVASERRQWYHHQLKDWRHVVPIRADLSDLKEKLHWCRNHLDRCEQIAQQGRQLALQVVEAMETVQLAAVRTYVEQYL